jgi:uncharacterized protein
VYRDEVFALLRAHREEILALGVKSLGIFGSVARGEERPDSDADVLVEFHADAHVGYLRFVELQGFLERLLGRPVHLATPRSIRPRLWAYIEPDIVDAVA